GGTRAAARNGINGNRGYGIGIAGNTATGNVVEGNYIGTNPAGTAPLGNGISGVNVSNGASGNTIGGTAVQAVTVTGNPAGKFTLSFNGVTTATLYPSSLTLAADLQAALNSLSSIVAVCGSVTVSPVNVPFN